MDILPYIFGNLPLIAICFLVLYLFTGITPLDILKEFRKLKSGSKDQEGNSITLNSISEQLSTLQNNHLHEVVAELKGLREDLENHSREEMRLMNELKNELTYLKARLNGKN